MTREEARTELASMVDATGTEPTLTDADLDTALTLSRIVDTEGRPPTDPDYVETFDLYHAAAECMLIRYRRTAMQGQGIQRFTAEGATFEKGAGPNWLALADWWRGQSPLTPAADGGIGVIEVDAHSTFVPRSAGYNTSAHRWNDDHLWH